MSNRLHQKNHRFNHHSLRLGQTRDPKYPDAGYDPIASFESPFQGEFYSQGDIITTQSLTANNNVLVGQNLTVLQNVNIEKDLIVRKNAEIANDLTVRGNFTVLGESSQIETVTHITSAVSITNTGSGPALRVEQTGFQPLAHFIDSNGNDIIFDDNGMVGLGTDTPFADLHLKRVGTTPEAEIRVQNTYEQGKTKLNLAGPVSDSQGCLLQYDNFTNSALLKNKNATPAGPSISFETATYQAIVIGTSGKVAIGPITNPPESLTVVGNISASDIIFGRAVAVPLVSATQVITPLLNATTANVAKLSSQTSTINSLSCTTISVASLSTQNIYVPVLNVEQIKASVGYNTAKITARPTTQIINLSTSEGEIFLRTDIELETTTAVTISSFVGGLKGISYTLTNASTNTITITSSPTVFVRGGTSWRSNTQSLSTAFLRLQPGHSCCLRAGANQVVSIW
jgi:hypothetical protein